VIPDYLKWWEWSCEPTRGIYRTRTHDRVSMSYVMDIDMVGNPTKDENPWYECKYFGDYIRDFPLPSELRGVDLKLYNVRRDTFKGSVESMMKYDRVHSALSVDIPMLRCAIEDTKRQLAKLEGKGCIKEFREVLVNPDGSCGVVFKKLGYDDRLDVIANEPDAIDWFHNNAHIFDVPILWKEFGKVELLKVNKQIRGISNPPVDFQISGARMNQHTNELLSKLGADDMYQPFGVGMRMQSGGLNIYAAWLKEMGFEFKSSDADKWDAGILAELFMIVKELRYYMWDKQGMSDREWWDRQNYQYAQKIYSYLVSSNGQVFQKDIGNPSGQDSTTYDNTLIHMVIKNYMWRKNTGLGVSSDAFTIMNNNYRTKLYGDDNNEAISEPFAKYYSFEKRQAGYAEFGITLSKDKDVDSNHLDGHVWLGKTIRWDANTGSWVGEVNSNKVLCSLLNMESRNVDPEVIYMRAIALLVESTWTEPLHGYIRGYCHWLKDQIGKMKVEDLNHRWFVSVPTKEMCKNFWLGRESGQPMRTVHESVWYPAYAA